MKSQKFRIGRAYRILFWDHCINMNRPIKCEVIGWVIDDSKTAVVLSHWIVKDSDEEVVKSNYEYTTIVKSCIINRKVAL